MCGRKTSQTPVRFDPLPPSKQDQDDEVVEVFDLETRLTCLFDDLKPRGPA